MVKNIEVRSHRIDCISNPTIYSFNDKDNKNYSFKLENGVAKITCLDTGETILSKKIANFNGIFGWNNVVIWAKENELVLKE